MNEMDKKYSLPVLTLEPQLVETAKETLTKGSSEEVEQVANQLVQNLSEEEIQMVSEFAKSIDVTNTMQVMQYGAAAQAKISSFSEQILGKVKTKDLDGVGKLMTDLVSELKGIQIEEEDKGFLKFFKKSANSLTQLKAKYDKADANVDKIVTVLEDHQVMLMKDIAMLDEMYRLNLQYFKELTMYILAGKKKLQELNEHDLPLALEKAQKTGLPEDAQAANDLQAMISRFEKKLHDLELTRTISMQMAPQIRLVQNSDALMVEKIQSSLVNTIPLWKSQMVLALGMANTKSAMQAQRSVTDFTNELLKRNAQTLKQGTIDVAKESERGIVDIETLTNTNKELIATLDEVLKIQSEGRSKRDAASMELQRIENELKNKLLELRK